MGGDPKFSIKVALLNPSAVALESCEVRGTCIRNVAIAD
jgi:hypothetical protein